MTMKTTWPQSPLTALSDSSVADARKSITAGGRGSLTVRRRAVRPANTLLTRLHSVVKYGFAARQSAIELERSYSR